MKEKNAKKETVKLESIVELIKEHKIKSILSGLVLVIVLLVGYALLDQGVGMKSSYDSYHVGMAPTTMTRDMAETVGEMDDGAPHQTPDDIPGIKVIEASAVIETEDAKKEESDIKNLTNKHLGYAEESRLSESSRLIRINMTLRIPSANFDIFFDELRENHDVESFNVIDYRIDVERRETQLNTIQRTIEMYSEMLEEVKTMDIGHERIDLTQKLTDQKMNLRKQENVLISSLQQSRRQSEYSTVRLVINEKISPKIWPENIGDRFKENIQRSLDRITESIVSALGNTMAIFITVIIWIIYAVVAIIPIWIGYRILRRIYIFMYRK